MRDERASTVEAKPAAAVAADAALIEPRDPLAQPRRAQRAIASVAAALLPVILTWALWPLARGETPPLPPLPKALASPANAAPSPADRLNAAAIASAKLWTPPPPPPHPLAPTSAVAVAPLKLQLLGIIEQEAAGKKTYLAAVYDEASDRVLIVGAGDTLASRRVRLVQPGAIELTEADGSPRRIAMEPSHLTGKGGL